MMASLWGELDTMQIKINKDSYDCQICDNNFTSPIQLTVHCIVFHGLLPCVHCLKLFESEHSLGDHTRIQHASEKPICPECSDEFSNQSDVATHISFTHAKRLCKLCGSLTAIDEQQHLSTLHKVADSTTQMILAPVNQNEFRCHLCHDEKTIERLDRLLFHYLYFHKCSLQSLIQCILKSNDIKSLQNKFPHDNVYAKCSTCGLRYTWSFPKIYHKIYCQGFIYCVTCTDCFDTQENHDKHLKMCRKKPFKISFCNDCNDSTTDDLHLRTEHKITTVTWSQGTSLLNAENHCNFCAENLSAKATNLNQIIDHFRIFHKFDATAILGYLKPGKNKIKTEKNEQPCDNKRTRENVAEIRAIDGDDNVEYRVNFDTKLVKYVYTSASDYDSSGSDDNIPRAINTYQCDVCDFRSRSKFIRAMHMHKKHGFALKTPEFRCNVCRKIFTSNGNLRKHNQNLHHKRAIGKRFNCSFCEFTCNGKTKIRQHISEHVEASYHPCAVKSIGFNCRYCHFIFWTREKLSGHQLSRHSDQLHDAYLLCSLCFAAFNNLATLRSHNTTRHFEFALDGNAFQCTICRIVLFTIDAIRFHMQELHPQHQKMYCAKENCMQVVTSEEELRIHWANQHTKTIFQCLECFKMFERKEFVENHMAVTHAAKSKMKNSQ